MPVRGDSAALMRDDTESAVQLLVTMLNGLDPEPRFLPLRPTSAKREIQEELVVRPGERGSHGDVDVMHTPEHAPEHAPFSSSSQT
jgi:hypothetical protein